MNLCLNCGKETTNPKFCSRSCSATFNNKKREKIKKYCKQCGALIGEGVECRRTLCENCNPNIIDWSNMTLGEVREKRQYQIHSRIRELARKKALKETRFCKCAECGYDKHIEVCHIKAISDFPDDTSIENVNDLSNLVGLCPNHHWEFDNGLLAFNQKWLE